MNEPLRTTLADAAAFLEKEGVAYALVGGLAVSVRGQPRVTADVDMVIAADVDRALALDQVLNQSKFRPLFDDVADSGSEGLYSAVTPSFDERQSRLGHRPIRLRATNCHARRSNRFGGLTGFSCHC